MTLHTDFTPIAQHLSAPIDESSWGRLNCRWDEEYGAWTLTHHYAPVVNRQTGEIYEDYSHLKIYAQMFAHCWARPIQIVTKTLYHLALPISLPHTLYVSIREERYEDVSNCYIAGKCIRRLVQCTLDIVRTPLYGTAMIIVSLAALVYKPTSSTQLYDFRATIAKIQRSLYWGSAEVDSLDFFQPIAHASNFENEHRLKIFTILIVDGRREYSELFNNPFSKLANNQAYYTPGFEPNYPPPQQA
jgi:hypothetical protein